MNPMAALATQIPHALNGNFSSKNLIFFTNDVTQFNKKMFHTGSGQPVNGTIPSLPSPTMPTFNMAAQTPNGQPAGTEAVYANGIPQSYAGRKCIL